MMHFCIFVFYAGRDDAVSFEALDSKGQKYRYSMNLCSLNMTDRGVMCGADHPVAVCQYSDSSPGSLKSLGQLEQQTLRLVLFYSKFSSFDYENTALVRKRG